MATKKTPIKPVINSKKTGQAAKDQPAIKAIGADVPNEQMPVAKSPVKRNGVKRRASDAHELEHQHNEESGHGAELANGQISSGQNRTVAPLGPTEKNGSESDSGNSTLNSDTANQTSLTGADASSNARFQEIGNANTASHAERGFGASIPGVSSAGTEGVGGTSNAIAMMVGPLSAGQAAGGLLAGLAAAASGGGGGGGDSGNGDVGQILYVNFVKGPFLEGAFTLDVYGTSGLIFQISEWRDGEPVLVGSEVESFTLNRVIIDGNSVITGFRFILPNYDGPVLARLNDDHNPLTGTYLDEAEGQEVNLDTMLRGFATIPYGSEATITLTPFTEAAIRLAESVLGFSLDPDDPSFGFGGLLPADLTTIDSAIDTISDLIGVDIRDVTPIAVNDPNFRDPNADDQSKLYGLKLAAFSELANTTTDEQPGEGDVDAALNGLFDTLNDAAQKDDDGNIYIPDADKDKLLEAEALLTEKLEEYIQNDTDNGGDLGDLVDNIDVTPPVAPTVISLVTSDRTPTVHGGAVLESGETLTVLINGVEYTTANGLNIDRAHGTWSVTLPDTDEGVYEVKAFIMDAAGHVTADSSSNELTIDLTPPAEPTIDGANPLTIYGTAEPGSTVKLYNSDGEVIAEVTADEDGNYLFLNDDGNGGTLWNQEDAFDVKAFDGASNESNPVNGLVEAAPPNIMRVFTMMNTPVNSPDEGDTVPLVFTISRTDAHGAASVDWSLLGLDPNDFADGELPFGTAVFENGSYTVEITIQVPASLSQEAIREAMLEIFNPSSGFGIDPDNQNASITIEDANALLTNGLRFTISATSQGIVPEGPEGLVTPITYTVKRTEDDTHSLTDSLTIKYSLVPSGAAILTGDDFAEDMGGVALSGLPTDIVLTFAPNEDTAQFTVYVRGDNHVGPDEQFRVALSDLPQDSRVFGTLTGKILTDDVYVSVASQSVETPEPGQVTHSFIITRSGQTEMEHSVSYTISGIGEQSATDLENLLHEVLSDTIVFAVGETERVITFTTVDDVLIAGYQTFGLTLTDDDNVTILNATAVSSIIPNLQEIEVVADVDRTLEGGDTPDMAFSYTVYRTGNTDQVARISWEIKGTGETETSASDFEGGEFPQGVLEFAIGETEKKITFYSAQDTRLEGDESFYIQLTPDVPSVRIITPNVTGVLLDDESAVGFNQSTVFEQSEVDTGTSRLDLIVERVGFSGNASVIEWRLSAGQATLADFASGQDLLGDNGGLPSGTLTLRPSELNGIVRILLKSDVIYEGDETFTVQLSGSSADSNTKIIGQDGVTFNGYDDSTSATIIDDDSLISIKAGENPKEVIEGQGGNVSYAHITIVRDGSTVGGDWVKWALYPGDQNPANAQDLSGMSGPVFDSYQKSWIDLVTLSGNQSASGSITLPTSGYVMVSYNRDEAYSGDSANMPFDQFILKNLSASAGVSITSMGSVVEENYVANDVSVTGYGQNIFQSAQGGLALPVKAGYAQQVTITSEQSLAGVYFRVQGVNASGQSIVEMVKGPNDMTVATANTFARVTSITTVAPGIAIGQLSPVENGGEYSATEFDRSYPQYGYNLTSWTDSTLRDRFGDVSYNFYDARQGASSTNEAGQLVINSEADLSDASFIINGGITIGYFDATTESTQQDFIEQPNAWGGDDFIRLDMPGKVRAEQIAGLHQTDDGSDAPNYFMISGLDAAGQQISEIVAVADFDPLGIAEIVSYTSGNMLETSMTLDAPGRVMISTVSAAPVLLSMALLEEKTGANFSNDTNIYFSINSSLPTIQTDIDGDGVWTNINSWQSISIADVEAGKVRTVSDMGYFGVYTNNAGYFNVQLSGSLVFTVTGTDTNGNALVETITASSVEEACIGTAKEFATVTAITANREFEWDIQIGVNASVETEHEFSVIYGIAPVDEAGEALANNEIPDGSGRFEFTIPKQFVVQGSDAGLAISTESLNYIDSIELIRDLPSDLKVDIGFNSVQLAPVVLTLENIYELTQPNFDSEYISRVYIEDYSGNIERNFGSEQDPDWQPIGGSVSLYAWQLEEGIYRILAGDQVYIEAYPTYYWWSSAEYDGVMPGVASGPNSNFLINSEGADQFSGVILNTLGSLNDLSDDTGNAVNSPDANLGYAIFYIDTSGASGSATLNFDIEQLGRYGFDTGHISYAPAGSFSENLDYMQGDTSSLLIDPLQVAEVVTILTLDDFTNNGLLETDNIGYVYLDGFNGQFQVNDGTAQSPDWVNFWNSNYYDENEDYLYTGYISAGMFRFVGAAGNLSYQAIDMDGNWPDAYYNAHAGEAQVLTADDFPQFAQNSSIAYLYMYPSDYEGIEINLGTADEPQWVSYYYWSDESDDYNYISVADIEAGKIRVFGGQGQVDAEYYDENYNYQSWEYVDVAAVDTSYDVVNRTGEVTLEGSGYIWLRYANVASGNDGEDQAWINHLSVSGGATLTVAGQKSVSDGVAMTQSLSSGADEISLNGVSTTHALPDGIDPSKLLIYLTPAEGMNRLELVRVTVYGKDTDGNDFAITRQVETNSTNMPRDGLTEFINLGGVSVASIDRIVYDEQTDSSNLYAPTLTIVEGSLNSLSDGVDVDSYYPNSLGSFGAEYKEFLPGAPLDLNTSYGMQQFAHLQLGAAASDLATNLSLNSTAERLVISTTSSLDGRSIVVTGVDDGGNSVTETLTFGADDRLLATTHLWQSVASVAAEEGTATGYINVGYATIYSQAQLFEVITGSSNGAVFTVHGLDDQGNTVSYRVDELTSQILKPVGAMKEFFGLTFETSGYVSVFTQSVNAETEDGFFSVTLDSAATNVDGDVLFDAPQRIVLKPSGDGSQLIFRVTGLDVEGNEIVEFIEGANVYDDGGAAITEHYFASVSDIAVSLPPYWIGFDGFEYIGTIGEPVIPEMNLSRFGGEVALGDSVAEFDTASQITFTTTDNLANRTLTIHGIDENGQAVVEEVDGFASSGGTLLSANRYLSVSKIEVSAGSDGAIKVGYVSSGGAMLDHFVITGSGTAEDPFIGHSTNTLESDQLYSNLSAQANASESDVLFYVNFNNAEAGSVKLSYDLSMRGAPEQDTLYMEYSADRIPLAQGVVYFADGESETQIDIPIMGDDTKESNEELNLVLTRGSTGLTINTDEDSAVIEIINDDDLVSMDGDAKIIREGTSETVYAEFTLTRTAPGIEKDVVWAISVDGLTASLSGDFEETTGVATFEEGATTTKVRVPLTNDNVFENDETFRVYLPAPASGSGYQLIGNTSALGTIDNDDVTVTVTVDHVELAEGSSYVFSFTRIGDLRQESVINWSVSGISHASSVAADSVDFSTEMSGTITIPAGSEGTNGTTLLPITITTINDGIFMGDRSFTFDLENADGDTSNITTPVIECKILEVDAINLDIALPEGQTDDEGSAVDPDPTAEVPFHSKTFTYTITRTGDLSRPLSINWDLLPKGATPSSRTVNTEDFTDGEYPSGTLVFEAGSATATITFDVISDDTVEVSESFTLSFSSPYAPSIPAQEVLRTLIGDDAGYGVTTEIHEITEGNGTGTYDLEVTFVRTTGLNSAADYDWEVEGYANADFDPSDGGDFAGGTLPGGSVHFEVGQDYVTKIITIQRDDEAETKEAFVIKMSEGATLLQTSEPVVILDDDAEVSIVVDKSAFTEGLNHPGYQALIYTVTRTGNLDQESVVNWTVGAQGGVTASDFVNTVSSVSSGGFTIPVLLGDTLGSNSGCPSGAVTFLAGQDKYRFALLVKNDSVFEPGSGDGTPASPYGELIQVNLASMSTGTSIIDGSTSHADTLAKDDDVLVRLTDASMVPQTIAEGNPSSGMYSGEYVSLTYNVERLGNTSALGSVVGWHVVATGSGTGYAQWNDDFVTSSGYLNFAAGETAKSFTVNVRSDYYYEGSEVFKVELYRTSATGYVTAATTDVSGPNNSVTATITETDINIRVVGAALISKAEGTEGVQTTYTWTVERFGALPDDGNTYTYNWNAGGIAYQYAYSYPYGYYYDPTNSADFITAAGTVSFTYGDNFDTISVVVKGDPVVENTESFAIGISANPGDVTRMISTPVGIVLRDEGEVVITNEIVSPTNFTTVYSSTAKAEGDTETVTHYFKVYRNYSTAGDVAVSWKAYGPFDTAATSVNNLLTQDKPTGLTAADFVDGNASGVDSNGNTYIASGTVTIPDGQAYTILEIKTNPNVTPEALRSFKVQLTDVTPGNSIAQYAGENSYGNGYIAEDDVVFSLGQPAFNTNDPLSIGSKIGEEGHTISYRVYRGGDASEAVTVDWKLNFPADGVTAGYDSPSLHIADANDFASSSGTLTFAANQTYVDLVLNVTADGVAETWGEVFSVELLNPQWATLPYAGTRGIGVSLTANNLESVILDKDAASLVSVAATTNQVGTNYETNPGDATRNIITYTLTRTGDLTGETQVGWLLSGGNGDDVYEITGDTLEQWIGRTPNNWGGYVTFGDGEGTKTITVAMKQDLDVYLDGNETFTMRLVDAKMQLSGGWDELYGADVNGDHGIRILEETINSPDSVNMLVDPDHGSASMTVIEDDIRIRVDNSFNGNNWPNLNVWEGNDGVSNLTLALSRGGNLEQDIVLDYDIILASASANDFADSNGIWTKNVVGSVMGSGQLTMVAGATSGSYVLPIIQGDTNLEGNETFVIRLKSGLDILTGNGNYSGNGLNQLDTTFTIKTDDIHWEVDYAAMGASKIESNATSQTFEFTIHRSGGANEYMGEAYVHWGVSVGSGLEHAIAADFIGGALPTGTVHFLENALTATVQIQVATDRLAEHDESFTVSVTGASIGSPSPTNASKELVIINDDSSVRIDDVSTREGDSGETEMTFTVTRYGTQLGSTPVDITFTSGGTASKSDFTDGDWPADATVQFDEILGTGSYYEETRTYTVSVNGDDIDERPDNFYLQISGVDDDVVTIGDELGVGTILNEDARFTITAGATVMEGNVAGQMFTITRTMATDQQQVIDWQVGLAGTGVRAARADDFADGSLASGSVTFESGSDLLTQEFFVAFNNDAIKELNEMYKVTITAGEGVQAGDLTKTIAYGTILNDDTNVGVGGEPVIPAADSHVSLVVDANGIGARVVEGHDGTTSLVFTIARSFDDAPYDGEIEWEIVLASGQTASLADFGGTLPSGTLVLPAGETSIEVSIPITGDSVFEFDETLTLTIKSLTEGMVVGSIVDSVFVASADELASAIGVIENDDALISLDDYETTVNVDEGAGTTTLTLTRSGDTTAEVTVDWELVSPVGGNSVIFTDNVISGSVTFAATETTQTIVLNWADNTLAQADTGYLVKISNPSLGASIDDEADERNVILVNDDKDHISFSIDHTAQTEGDPADENVVTYTSYVVTVNRENPATSMNVTWTAAGTGDHPLPADAFLLTTDTISFAPGELQTTFIIQVRQDLIGDFDRTFNITLSDPLPKIGEDDDPLGAEVVTDPLLITVDNDDPAFSVALIGTKSFVEGSGAATKLITFEIYRDGDTHGAATVDWQIEHVNEDGVAAATMGDFGGFWPKGTATFEDGESFKRIQIAVSPDTDFEVSEAFDVVLSNLVSEVTGARIVDENDRGLITNDDNGIFAAVEQTAVTEGDAGELTPVTFTIDAVGVAGQVITVHFVFEGTGNYPTNLDDISWDGIDGAEIIGSPVFDEDTLTGSVQLRVNSQGQASASLTMNVVGDGIAGEDEQFRLRITGSTNASIADGQVVTTIENDDSLVALSPVSVELLEGPLGQYTEHTFTVTRTGDLTRAAVVDFEVDGFGDNQATSDDYSVSTSSGGIDSTGTLVFAAGESTQTITIRVLGDDTFESDESLAVRLLPGTQQSGEAIAEIDSSAELAVAVIKNDDLADLLFSPVSSKVYEGNDTAAPNGLTYEIIRNGDNTEALEVSYVISSSTITDPTELAANFVDGLTGTFIIPAGQSRGVLTIPLAANTDPQADRQFSIAISAPGFADPAALDGTIVDDESGISISLSNASQPEGDAGFVDYVFTVSRAGNLGVTTVSWELGALGLKTATTADFEDGFVPYGDLVFDADQVSATITVRVKGDTIVESDELFHVSLTASSDPAQRILVSLAEATIANDDLVSDAGSTIEAGNGMDIVTGKIGDDDITGGLGASLIHAGDGNDVIRSGGGADSMYGDAGDDTIMLDANSIEHFNRVSDEHVTTYVDGGDGVDTLVLAGSLDVSQLLGVSIQNVERIDMTGEDGVNNTLTLSVDAVITQDKGVFDTGAGFEDYHQLLVDGDAGDSVVLTDTAGVWSSSGTPFNDGVSYYDVYFNEANHVQLLVRQIMEQPQI